MKKNVILLTSAMALMISFGRPAIADGILIDEYRPNYVVYNLFTEDFSPSPKTGKPSNIGAWSYNGIDAGDPGYNNGFGKIIKSDNGKYGIQVGDPERWNTAIPSFGTHELSSPFTGDYVKKGVVSLSFETRILNDLIFKGGRPITLALRGKDGFTLYKTMLPCEPVDTGVYCPHVPDLPTVRIKYTFLIPKTSVDALREGWGIYNLNDVGETHDFAKYFASIMEDVKKVDFLYGAPRLAHGLQEFAIEATNVTIVNDTAPKVSGQI